MKGITMVSPLFRCVVLVFIIFHPPGVFAYDAPWDGGHQTTSPGGSPGGGPPGGRGQGGGGDPVNLKAGNFGWSVADVVIPGLGHPLFIIRSYNSQDRYIGPFGYGWHFMPMMRCIEVVSGDSLQVIVKRGDGIRKIYDDNGDGTYTSEDGDNRHTLTKDQTGYSLSDFDNVTYHFNLDGVLETVSDMNGNSVTYGYDGQGRISTLIDASARQLSMTYDANNRIVSIDDFAGRTVSYTYDAGNNLTEFTNALGQKTFYTYSDEHLLLSVTDPAGTALIANNYDSRKRVTSQLFKGQNVSFTYNSTYTRVNNRRNLNFDVYLNDIGNPSDVQDPSGSNYQMAFTATGQPASLTDSQGLTQVAYDSLGRIRSYITPDGSPIIYTYLNETQLVTSATDLLGRVTTYDYDVKQNLIRIINPLLEETQYQYYANGKIKKVIYSDGSTVELTYSPVGYLTLLTDRIGTDVFSATYTYDSVGNVTSIVMADGSSVVNLYNSLNQLIMVTDSRFSPTRVTEYEYDLGGNMTVVRQDGQEKNLQYSQNLVSSITYPNAAQTIYTFNGNDQISQVNYSQGNVLYQHNNVERVTKATHPDSSEFDFSWTNDNLAQITGPGTNLTLQYDINRRLTGIIDNSTTKSTYFSYAGTDQRTQMTHSGGYYRNYLYDAAGGLLSYLDSDATTETFALPIKKKRPATLNEIATAVKFNKNNWLIQLLQAKGPGGAVSKNEVRYPGTEFWHNSFSANKRWHLSLMPGLSSNRLNINVRTPMDIMR